MGAVVYKIYEFIWGQVILEDFGVIWYMTNGDGKIEIEDIIYWRRMD